jgi:ribonuclease P/MRP protein subunit RPP1
MYEAVRADPGGESTVARFAAAAAAQGFEGVAVRNAREAMVPPTFDGRDDYAAAIAEEYDVAVVWGIELTAPREELRGAVRRVRDEYTLVAVRGGTPGRNRFAVETPEVDVLTAPMRRDGDVNHVLARAAAENGVRLEFDLSRILRATGGRRVRALRGLRKLRELAADTDAPCVVSAAPESHLHLRAPRELAAVGAATGFDGDAIRAGLHEWGQLAARNRQRASEEFIAPGVRKGRHDG